MRKEGHKLAQQKLERFIRRAIEADMAYMREIDVIDEAGLMGEDEYDDDDAFEALLERLCGDTDDEDAMDAAAQLLNSYMEAQQAFMEASGLME